MLVFTMVVSMICGVAFGLTPALRSARVQVASNLKDETPPAGYRKSRLRSMLMTGQIATCAVLLVGSSLCVRSLRNASSIDPGFNTQHVIAATLDPQAWDIPKRKFAPFMNSYRSTSSAAWRNSGQLRKPSPARPWASITSVTRLLAAGPSGRWFTKLAAVTPGSARMCCDSCS